MLDNEKILITGATGKIAFPIARALAQRNEVWGAARLRDQAARDRLADAGITPIAFDMSSADFSALPDDFTYVFHAAVDVGAGEWSRCVDTNAQNSGELLFHCRAAKGFVFCSTGSIYGYQGRRRWPVVGVYLLLERGESIIYCLLDDDPIATAKRLRAVLAARVGAGRRRTAAGSTVLPGCVPSVGSLCAVGGSDAHRPDGRFRRGALTRGPTGWAA